LPSIEDFHAVPSRRRNARGMVRRIRRQINRPPSGGGEGSGSGNEGKKSKFVII
jgi:hypothetical protein